MSLMTSLPDPAAGERPGIGRDPNRGRWQQRLAVAPSKQAPRRQHSQREESSKLSRRFGSPIPY
jgi:hypothetical protein